MKTIILIGSAISVIGWLIGLALVIRLGLDWKASLAFAIGFSFVSTGRYIVGRAVSDMENERKRDLLGRFENRMSVGK
jgi:Kef-type K+ transport system membrane component KefB